MPGILANALEPSSVPALIVGVVALAVVLQHFVQHPPGARSAPPSAMRHWLRQGAAGLLLVATSLLVASFAIDLSPCALGIAWGDTHQVLGWVALAAGVMAIGSYVASRGPGFRDHYPEAPVARWTRRSWLANAAAWAVYLAGYELLFRGLCLRALVDAWGVTSGVAVTTALYAVAHLPKNLSESLGSFPMGVVLAALTLASGSLLPAFLVHLLMALAADSFALLPKAEGSEGSAGEGAVGHVDAADAAAEGGGG